MKSKQLDDDIDRIKHFCMSDIAEQYQRMANALERISDYGTQDDAFMAREALERFKE